MKAVGRTTRWWNREFRVGTTLLCLYGMALICSDPEWAMWAGAMSVGALLVEAPPALLFPPAELFAGAGALGLAGAVAFAALLLTGEKMWWKVHAPWEQEKRRWLHGTNPPRWP